jgi:hypothetical protein
MNMEIWGVVTSSVHCLWYVWFSRL